MERIPIGKKLKFEVFKRDKFTCQYCGRAAPDVILHVDHIKPVVKDGDNNITNLITSCADCNLGKGKTELSDDAVILKQKKQLDALQERREQLEMVYEWQKSLLTIQEDELNMVIDFWKTCAPGYSLTDYGINNLKTVVRKYGLSETLESIRISVDQYLIVNGSTTIDTVNKTLDYIPKIAYNRKKVKDNPHLNECYYIRGILKNKGFYLGWNLMPILEEAVLSGHDFETLKSIAIKARNWTDWRDTMEAIIGKGEDNG